MHRFPRRALGALAVATLAISGTLSSLAITATSAGATTPAWHSDVRPTPEGSWYAVAYNNKTWVATGRTGDVAYSSDAVHWTMVPVLNGSWQSLAYGKGLWVTLSADMTVPGEMTSVSGKLWTSHLALSGSWSSLAYGNGIFVAVGFDGRIMTSTDALHWTLRHGSSSNVWYAVAHGNGRFVAVDGTNGDTAVSFDGINWAVHHAPTTSYGWGGVAYGNGTFVAFDDNNTSLMATSVNGANWTYHHYGFAGRNYSGTFGCNQFFSVTSFGAGVAHYQFSSTGASWAPAPTSIDTLGVNWGAVGYGNGKYVAVNDVGDITWKAAPASCKQAIPDPVTNVHGTIGAGSLTVNWSPPSYGGVKRVASYVVKLTNGSVIKRCYSATTTCHFHSLLARHTYGLSVSAVNGAHLFSVPTDPLVLYSSGTSAFSVERVRAVYLAGTPASAWVSGAPSNWSVTVRVGATSVTCGTNSFGQCLLQITPSAFGKATLLGTFTLKHVTHHAAPGYFYSLRLTGFAGSYPNGGDIYITFTGGVPLANGSITIGAVTTSMALDATGAGTVMAVAPGSGTSASLIFYDAGVYIDTFTVGLTV